MAQLIVSMNLSLDGYIEAAGQDDGSWLRIDQQLHEVFNDLAAGAASLLYGRKVYEVMPPYWPEAATDSSKPAHERRYGAIWVEKPKVVFSSTLQETRWSTRVVATDPVAEVQRLKREAQGYLLCYGGAQLASALEAAGLVDEYALFVHPSALGGGLPFFRGRVGLELVDVRRFEQGAVGLRYARSKG